MSVPVLMYHHVCPLPGMVSVSPQTFERQMKFLASSGYTTLTSDEFLDFLAQRAQIPKKSVLITFDDGYLDNYIYAFPILKQYRVRATIFVVTGWIGDGPVRQRTDPVATAALPATPDHEECRVALAAGRADDVMLRWSEIREMEASGLVDIQSHTHSHICWDKVYSDLQLRMSELESDLRLSRQTLREKLGRDSRHLCWPWGYFEPDYLSLATRVGFEGQYTVAKGVNLPGSDPQQIHRVVVKDRAGRWFSSRLWIYRHSAIGRLYVRLRGA
jgi:peptidoglycan/xylan/chitin deacetylase (PgdA/CDA1 family)